MTICSSSMPLSITQLLYAVRPFPEKEGLPVIQVDKGHCWLCGLEIVQGIPCREIIRPSFTNLGFALTPTSPYLCRACAYCLKEPAFRRTCFLVGYELGFVPFKRKEGIDILRGDLSGPWACYLTHSYRKYHFLRTPLNFPRQESRLYSVQFETHLVQIDNMFWELASVLQRLLPYGTKKEFRTGEYRYGTIEQIGVTDFLEAEDVLSSCRGCRAFDLAMFLC